MQASGISFPALLTLLFITLKLTGVISWSWIWVLFPLWIGFVILLLAIGTIFVFGLFTVIMAAIIAAVATRKK